MQNWDKVLNIVQSVQHLCNSFTPHHSESIGKLQVSDDKEQQTPIVYSYWGLVRGPVRARTLLSEGLVPLISC